MATPPATADRTLTTLALLRVNFEQQAGYLASYLPFVYDCLEQAADEPVAGRPLRDALKAQFDLDLPLGVVKNLLALAVKEGKVRRAKGMFLPVPDKLVGSVSVLEALS